MASPALLKTCFEVMHFTGASRLFRSQFQGVGVVFCLHHVCPGGGVERGFSPNYQLEYSPDFLDSVISLVRVRGYDLISVGDVKERITNPAAYKRPFAVFTLDDGYRDNMIHAAPVFRKHDCPYAIYVCPRIAEGTAEIWWRALEAIIAGSQRLDIEIGGVRIDVETGEDVQKQQAWKSIFPLLKALPEYEQRIWIREACEQQGIDLGAYCRSVAMNWDELRLLNSDPLCTIGAHTLNHYAVARLSEDDARREIADSGRIVGGQLGEVIQTFAFPYGDEPAAGPRDFAIAKDAGYVCALTTRKGVVFPEHASHLHGLPRVMLSGRYQKLRYVDALISGTPLALLNRFRRVNVS
jgi:peptidoglycan/xylan/chitin deacetylase (PgdA/CDA1 family)